MVSAKLRERLENWSAPLWLVQVLTVVPAVLLGAALAAIALAVYQPIVGAIGYGLGPWVTAGYWWRSSEGWTGMLRPLLAAAGLALVIGFVLGLLRGLPALIGTTGKAWSAWSGWMDRHADIEDPEAPGGMADVLRAIAGRTRDRFRGSRPVERAELDAAEERPALEAGPAEPEKSERLASVVSIESARRWSPYSPGTPDESDQEYPFPRGDGPVWPGHDGEPPPPSGSEPVDPK